MNSYGEVGTDGTVKDVVSRVAFFSEKNFHSPWILSNIHCCILSDHVRDTCTVHEIYDAVGHTVRCDEGDHGSSSADWIGSDYYAVPVIWDIWVDGCDDRVEQMDALLLVGKHDETEMTVEGCYMAKVDTESDGYHTMVLNCCVLL